MINDVEAARAHNPVLTPRYWWAGIEEVTTKVLRQQILRCSANRLDEPTRGHARQRSHTSASCPLICEHIFKAAVGLPGARAPDTVMPRPCRNNLWRPASSAGPMVVTNGRWCGPESWLAREDDRVPAGFDLHLGVLATGDGGSGQGQLLALACQSHSSQGFTSGRSNGLLDRHEQFIRASGCKPSFPAFAITVEQERPS